MTLDWDSSDHRILIDACLRHRVPFFWSDPGTIFIEGKGLLTVLSDVEQQGFEIIGVEGFIMESTDVHPQLHLIFDSERRAEPALKVVSTWPKEIWYDVVLR